jgi:hypothetical protein
MEFAETITVTHLICLAGLILFARWLLKTSLGRKALADSVPRRNNMPAYLPFVPLFICFGTVWLIASITHRVFGDLQGWQSNFLDNLILCISELMSIVVIIFLARIHFARRLKGFGLNVKTIVKDFFAAFVNLLTVCRVPIKTRRWRVDARPSNAGFRSKPAVGGSSGIRKSLAGNCDKLRVIHNNTCRYRTLAGTICVGYMFRLCL